MSATGLYRCRDMNTWRVKTDWLGDFDVKIKYSWATTLSISLN